MYQSNNKLIRLCQSDFLCTPRIQTLLYCYHRIYSLLFHLLYFFCYFLYLSCYFLYFFWCLSFFWCFLSFFYDSCLNQFWMRYHRLSFLKHFCRLNRRNSFSIDSINSDLAAIISNMRFSMIQFASNFLKR